MQVSVLYFADCPNWHDAGQRLRQSPDEIGFAGSPAFLMDGDDLLAPAPAAGGLACRMYATTPQARRVPEVADLVAALTKKVKP